MSLLLTGGSSVGVHFDFYASPSFFLTIVVGGWRKFAIVFGAMLVSLNQI